MPEANDAFNDFVGGFAHQYFLTRGESDNRIGVHFDVLNEIGIDDYSELVETRQSDHIYLFGKVGGRNTFLKR